MALLKKRSTVLGLPMGRRQFAWDRVGSAVGVLVAVGAGLVAAVRRGAQSSEAEGGEEGEGESAGESGDAGEGDDGGEE